MTTQAIYDSLHSRITQRLFEMKGGEGSGNFNHAGRPGERGGSSSSGGGEGMRGGQDKEPAPTNNKFSFEMVDKKPVYGALNQFENNSVRSKDLVEVKISDLYSTQHRHEFSKAAVEEYRKKFEKDPDKAQGRDGAPVVMLYKGKMYLMNGHHRTAGASAAGRETIKVWLHTSKGKEEKKSLPPEYLKSTHTFATTQINIDTCSPDGSSISKRIRALARLITDDLLAEDGREDTPHITLKYGLESDSPAEVRRLLANEHAINFTFGPVDVFEAKETGTDSDVVMLRIYSPDLVRLNKLLTDKTENETTFEYSPHCTLAYVLSGEGAQFRGMENNITGLKLSANAITFSDRDGKETKIRLGGAQAMAQRLSYEMLATSIRTRLAEMQVEQKGGSGSGNFGHSGRPGERGGSSSEGGGSDRSWKEEGGGKLRMKGKEGDAIIEQKGEGKFNYYIKPHGDDSTSYENGRAGSLASAQRRAASALERFHNDVEENKWQSKVQEEVAKEHRRMAEAGEFGE